MKTLKLDDKKVVELLEAGEVGVLPTDTVYGLVCNAKNTDAVARLYKLKGREKKPGTVIAASIDQLEELGMKRRYLTAVERYWPGPISVVIPNYELAYLHLGQGGIAVRIPQNATLSQLLSKTGPLLTTSANHSGEPEANTITEAQTYFGESVDFYVDGGDLSGQKPSTVIRVVDDAVEVLREGAVKVDEETGRVIS